MSLGSQDNQIQDIQSDLCAGVVCNDDNPCTDDICNAMTGRCVFTNDNTNICGDSINTDCDNPDTCVAGICQDNNEPTTTVCRAANGVCDVPEYCDGAGLCPADAVASATTECRAQMESVTFQRTVTEPARNVLPTDSSRPIPCVMQKTVSVMSKRNVPDHPQHVRQTP